MIRIVNESTGKEALVIKDNHEVIVNGKVTESESDIKEAFDNAKKPEGEK